MEAVQRHWLQVHQVALTEQKMNDNMTVEDRKWVILTWVWIHGRHRSNSLNKLMMTTRSVLYKEAA